MKLCLTFHIRLESVFSVLTESLFSVLYVLSGYLEIYMVLHVLVQDTPLSVLLFVTCANN